jgi:predicted RNase H-like nuclease (RuvC/YqgF family)
MDQNREEIAQKLYRVSYEKLSAFGRREVDRRIDNSAVKTQPSLLQERQAITQNAEGERLARLTARVTTLEQENEDLWRENDELKAQLVELTNNTGIAPKSS